MSDHKACSIPITVEIAPGPQVAAIVDPFYERHGGRTRASEHDTFFVAKHDGAVVGVSRFCYEEGVPMLRGMLVDPNVRHKGVGVVLLDEFARFRLAHNIENVYCLPSLPLEHFYERIGFKRVDERDMPEFLILRKKGYIGSGNPCVCMKL